jgi:phosphatidylserine decarboxylase
MDLAAALTRPLALLPLTALSAVFGHLARLPIPRPLRRPFFSACARILGADRSTIAASTTGYRSLAAWFEREPPAGARPLAEAASLVWPCDGVVVAAARIDGGLASIEVKGTRYEPAALLGEVRAADALRDGWFVNVYLHPGDLHRVYAPCSGRVQTVRRLSGTRLPLHAAGRRTWPDVLSRNARVVVSIEMGARDGEDLAGDPDAVRRSEGARPCVHVVLVASLNVDAIARVPSPGDHVRIGDEIGAFRAGSSVVTLFPAAVARPSPLPDEGDRVRCRAELTRSVGRA